MSYVIHNMYYNNMTMAMMLQILSISNTTDTITSIGRIMNTVNSQSFSLRRFISH
jgi:hypothetical protein